MSSAVSSLLVFINAHLALNSLNKVAIIASHCNKAQWLYPSPSRRTYPPRSGPRRRDHAPLDTGDSEAASPAKKLKLTVSQSGHVNGDTGNYHDGRTRSTKYRPFRLIEEEIIQNLNSVLESTLPDSVAPESSTMIAGALTQALSYINREIIAYTESMSGFTNTASTEQSMLNPGEPSSASSQPLDTRIFLLSVSPSPDLAHQYIPIMNSIFACQRLSIPIDVLQIPLPTLQPVSTTLETTAEPTPTTASPFLQQASDATHGIYIAIPPSDRKPSLTTYMLSAFLSSPSARTYLVLPTSISVDFRAACFCHRKIVSIGFVCSICLSIFCEPPENGDCLTCGTHLSMGDFGSKPVVVARKKKKKRKD